MHVLQEFHEGCKCPNISSFLQIEERFTQLMKLLKKKEKMDN